MSDELNADTVAWFQRRIDMLEAQINAMSVAIVEARSPERVAAPKSFRGMGHRRESRDLCENCGLTGQGFEESKKWGRAIPCPMTQIDGSGSS